jgi:hypothetical protein
MPAGLVADNLERVFRAARNEGGLAGIAL